MNKVQEQAQRYVNEMYDHVRIFKSNEDLTILCKSLKGSIQSLVSFRDQAKTILASLSRIIADPRQFVPDQIIQIQVGFFFCLQQKLNSAFEQSDLDSILLELDSHRFISAKVYKDVIETGIKNICLHDWWMFWKCNDNFNDDIKQFRLQVDHWVSLNNTN